MTKIRTQTLGLIEIALSEYFGQSFVVTKKRQFAIFYCDDKFSKRTEALFRLVFENTSENGAGH